MAEFIYDDELLAQWVGVKLGRQFQLPCRCIGVSRGDELLAVALFNNYDPPNIEITFVTTTPRWASRQVIGRILAYPFRELGCRRLTAVTSARNIPTRAFLRRLGFSEEGFHPELFEDSDGVSYGLLRRNAERWLEHYHEGTEGAGITRSVLDGSDAEPVQHQERDSQ
jgi:RimJ/RimL family protein N-acetyltransferase